jgi:three-Cys-motif partner protein
VSVPKETRWKVDPHSVAKHQILRKYLDAWFPILLNFNNRVVYIDGFAGPGAYAGGQPGSPIVALEAARIHSRKVDKSLVFWFIEKKLKRVVNLKRCIEAMKLPAHFDVNVHQGTFADDLTHVLDGLHADNARLAPSRINKKMFRRILEVQAWDFGS